MGLPLGPPITSSKVTPEGRESARGNLLPKTWHLSGIVIILFLHYGVFALVMYSFQMALGGVWGNTSRGFLLPKTWHLSGIVIMLFLHYGFFSFPHNVLLPPLASDLRGLFISQDKPALGGWWLNSNFLMNAFWSSQKSIKRPQLTTPASKCLMGPCLGVFFDVTVFSAMTLAPLVKCHV